MGSSDVRNGPKTGSRQLLPLVLADDLTEGLVVIDRESRVRYANPAMTRIFGYGRDELEGESLTVLMPEELQERHRQGLRRYLSTGERSLPWSDVEFPGLHRDGHRLDLRVTFSELTWRGERLFAGTIRDRTVPKGPEEERRILVRSYRALFEEDVAAVFRTAPDGRVLAANGALARMAGLEDPDELRGRDMREFYAEGEHRDEFLRDLREHREVRNRELRLRRSDGTTRWCLVNAVWIDDPQDVEPEVFVGTVVDISERKRAERELQLSQERYRRLFDQEVAGVYRSKTGPDGRVIECNEAFAEIFGYESAADVAGTPARAFYPEDEDRQDTVEIVREDGAVVKYEARLRRKDGSLAWGLAHARLVEDPEHGEILEGMIFDITPRVHAREALERAKEKYETVFSVSPVAIAVADQENDRFVEANPAFEELFGYGRDELSERELSPGRVWADPEEREAVVRDLAQGEEVRDREVRFRRKDGSEWDALFSATLTQVDGREYLIGGAQDISEQKRAREALARAEEKFRGVFEISPVALKVVEPESETILEANATFEDVFGYDHDELVTGEVGTEDLWRSSGDWRRIRERLWGEGQIRDKEVQLRRQDGTVFDALYSGAVLQLEHGPLLVCAVQDISHLKEVERELEHRSLHDRLTGLPNRALFWDRLEHALERSQRTGERVAVLFLDLDGFKRVNDEHGHGAGDEVLRRVAERLRSAVREADTLARLGGDEFGVLLEDLADESDALKAARRLTDRFEPAVPVAGEEALLHVSCGIALAGGDRDESVTADELVHRADRAMYVAKERPGSSSQLYSPEVAGERTGRLRREIELKEALGAGEVVPHFQPIVDLEDGRVVGAEALARWVHPERGLILPGEFIPLAEETGLIVELGRQVVRAACGQLSRWREGGFLPPDFRLHVNLSAREIEAPDALERLAEMFRNLDVDPEWVAFEVTESVAVEAAHVLRDLRELGSPVAVDDFGTQYATLERLVEIELDSLKLDRSFVNGIGESSRHEAVLDASLTLAESLGLCPVAEGVETERQRQGLLERGCRYGQGFLFARAMPAEEFEDWLEEKRHLPVE